MSDKKDKSLHLGFFTVNQIIYISTPKFSLFIMQINCDNLLINEIKLIILRQTIGRCYSFNCTGSTDLAWSDYTKVQM